MRTKKLLHKILYVVAAFILSLFVVFEYTFSKAVNANAATISKYTDVLDDLTKSGTFNVKEYPAITDVTNENVYDLQVIQVAESSDDEIFVYVYQAGHYIKDLVATSVNMSVTADDTLDCHDYDLTLVSTDGVFDKYVVEDVAVPSSVVRFYNLAAIRRAFDKDIDEKTDNDNEVAEIAYTVGKKWTATTHNDEVFYSTDVIVTERITGKYAGFIRYTNANIWSNSYAYESFFVAFKTENKIEDLISVKVYADVYKNVATWHCWGFGIEAGQGVKSTKINDNEFVATRGEQNSYKTSCFGKTEEYIWDEIQTASEFINQKDLTLSETAQSEVTAMDWVLRFYNAPRVYKDSTFMGYGKETDTYYTVSNVSILELTFIKDGDIHVVGVVDNKQTGSDTPSGIVEDDDWPDWVYLLIYGFLALLGIGALIAIGVFGKPLFKLAWKVICVPFKLLGRLFKALGKLFKSKK